MTEDVMEAFNVETLPLQIVAEVGEIENEGEGFTVTATVAVFEQPLLAPPLLSVPVTV
jgi:hypothetical protein